MGLERGRIYCAPFFYTIKINALIMSDNKTQIINQVVQYLKELHERNTNPNLFVFYGSTRKRVGDLIDKGYVYDDFVCVVDYLNKKWRNTEYEKYIRAETIFGHKFETYFKDARKGNTIQRLHNAVEQAKQLVDRGVVKLRRGA